MAEGEETERPKSLIPNPQPVVPGSESPGLDTIPDIELPGEGANEPLTDSAVDLPEIFYDVALLPEPVQRMRKLIIAACESGDPEMLRPLIGSGEQMTQLSLGGIEGDPIDYLRQISGDENGQEILAILLEIMRAGYVHTDIGTPQELYVWPYFFAYPLDKLDPRQRVELFTIVTAGDYEDMKSFGAYIFYRTGITPDGEWVFFVAGD